MAEVSRRILEAALVDADFPARKNDLLEMAGPDVPDEVRRALRSLPPEIQYADVDEVVASVTMPVLGR